MKKVFAFILAVSSVVALQSCNRSSAFAPNVSNIMLVNGCSGSVILGLSLSNGSLVSPSSGYLDSSGYQYVVPGNDNFIVYNADTSTQTALARFAATLVNGGYYSVFAGGTMNKDSVFFTKDVLPTLTGNNASLRLVNTCADSGAASIIGSVVGASGPILFASGIAYQTASAFTQVPAGVYTIKTTGVSPGNEVDTTNIALNPGKIYTVVYSGTGPTYHVGVIPNN